MQVEELQKELKAREAELVVVTGKLSSSEEERTKVARALLLKTQQQQEPEVSEVSLWPVV